MNDDTQLAATEDVGDLGICHIKRIWSATMATRSGARFVRDERQIDELVLNALGLGYHQTLQQLFTSSSKFKDFEHWIVKTAGRPNSHVIERLNATLLDIEHSEVTKEWLKSIEESESVLTAQDLAHWEEYGFVILKNAVSDEACRATEQLIWDYVEASVDDVDSWYQTKDPGIMVELIQHEILHKNRHSERIHKAFYQLWQTADLWPTADRCGFHPPQKEYHPFPGPDLHWDVDFTKPITFCTQGILYLTDTPAEQGALTVVPGFHHKLDDWLKSLSPDADPQQQDLHALGSKPIGGAAGDLVIWHQSLPHGSRPNLGTLPRIVQYINMRPGRY